MDTRIHHLAIRLLIAVTLVVLTGISSAADKKEGRQLIENAQKASDIRAEGAPPFRIEGKLQIVPKSGAEKIDGRYSEIWASSSKWRREIETLFFHRVEIGGPTRKWLTETGSELPRLVPYELLTLTFSKTIPDVHGISQRSVDGVNATCVKSKTKWSEQVRCVDPAQGVYLLQEEKSSVDYVCTYRNYEQFGGRLFARLVKCTSDAGDVELTVTKLVADTSPEESLFSKPEGAVEVANCLTRVTPPQAIYSPNPAYPKHHDENVLDVLWTIISADGKPQNVRIARSAGKDFDELAIQAVRQWKFKPATCEGAPVPVEINIEVAFRKF